MTQRPTAPTVVAMSNMRTNTDAARPYGRACAAGAIAMVVLAATTQWVQSDTDISTHQLSYPWWSEGAVFFYLATAAATALLALGIVGLARRGVTGESRSGAAGVWVALAGTLLILAGDLATIPLRHERIEQGWPKAVLALFGTGTVLTAIGFLLAGAAILRAGIWQDWRRFAPLAIGVCAVALVPIQFTGVLALGIGVYSLAFLALGVALAGRPAAFTDVSPARHQSAVL
jgi:hypothetical protein